MYFFNSKNADGQGLVHLINLMLGDDAVGAEVGVFRGITTCTLVQNCPGIKKLYAIDSWVPYTDYIKEPYNSIPSLVFDKKDIEFVKLTALHNIEYSGASERVQVIEMESNEAAKLFDDNFLDFIFLDAHLTIEQLHQDLVVWCSKVRPGGIIAVHDTNIKEVHTAVLDYIKIKNIKSKISIFCDTIIWLN